MTYKACVGALEEKVFMWLQEIGSDEMVVSSSNGMYQGFPSTSLCFGAYELSKNS